MERRQYQVDCAIALWDAIQDPQCSPVVAVPTGAGFYKKKFCEQNDEIVEPLIT